MLSADLILTNADVITMDPGQPAAELVAIKGDRILLVGNSEELEQVTTASTRIIDCQGKTVIPGFNDAHCHIFSFIRKLLGIDLSRQAVSSIADIKTVIRQRAQNTPPGTWLTGNGYDDFYLAEKRHPTRWDLDEVAPRHPVVLAHRGLHACVLNSPAMSLAGISSETPEPPGASIEREPATGEPTGLLLEMLGYIREKVIPRLSEEELTEGIALANQHYLSCGITSLQEATVSNSLERWQIYQRFKDKLGSRLSMMFGIEALSQFQEAGLAPGSGDSKLRLAGVKILLNETSGQVQPAQSELNRQALAAHRAGFQLAIHAVQPGAVEAAIAALEYVQNHHPQAGQRHRIEHCSVCPPPLLERLKKLQAVVVAQPPFIYYSGERYLATVETAHLPWLYRFKSLLDSGLMVAASSDSPVVPHNPLVGIYAAVTRQAESGQSVLPAESISVEQALAVYTINAAYASFEEDIKGSLIQGKLADMVILSANPVKVPPQQIKDIRVEMTIINGKIVWET